MNRRDLLKGLMAGGMIVAGELWIPGNKLISIPTGKVFKHGPSITNGKVTLEAPYRPEGYTLNEFYNWLMRLNDTGKNPMTPAFQSDMPTAFMLEDNYELATGLDQLRDGSIQEGHTGEWYTSFAAPGSHLEDSGLQRQAIIPASHSVGCRPVTPRYKRPEYVFEDLV